MIIISLTILIIVLTFFPVYAQEENKFSSSAHDEPISGGNFYSSQNESFLQGTESIISTSGWSTDQETPAIWDEYIVWADKRGFIEDSGCYQSDIYSYNILTGEEVRITTTDTDEVRPDIWRDRIVWQVYDATDYDFEIVLYNLTTGEQLQLTNDAVQQIYPRIWGDYIVWQEGDEAFDPEPGIYLYDCSVGSTIKLTENSPFAIHPAIWEDRIVWEDSRYSYDSDIFLFNLTEGTETRITSDPNYQIFPSVWGDRIVWEDERDGPSQVYIYDLGTEEELRITSGDFSHSIPVIYGDYIAYSNESDYADISLIDLVHLNEKVISSARSLQWNPDIWGNRVVWQDQRNGDGDIFLYSVGPSLPPLTPAFTQNTTQGSPPLTIEFTDNTPGQIDGWLWDFGDGGTSDAPNPVHVYQEEGSYTVILTVHNSCQRAAERKIDLISAGSEPVAWFTQNQTSGPVPMYVMFEDESSGNPKEWRWDFGDGETSDAPNPVHIYSLPGVYSVNMNVSNTFGTSSVEKRDLISVMDGTYRNCIFTAEGIELIPEGDTTILLVNLTRASNCTFDPQTNSSEIVCLPEDSGGIIKVVFFTPPESQFTFDGLDTITGILGGVSVTSSDISPLNFSSIIGETCSYNFSLALSSYYPGEIIKTVSWEGCTPDDFKKFDAIKSMENYAIIEALAYTVKFDENITPPCPATLVFGVSSDWVRDYGWGDNRTLDIRSVPEGARVYVDTVYLGQTPLNATSLSPGPHEVKLVMTGFQETTCTMVIADERDSIHVIRIGDDGTGEVLNTTFIGHDPERNLDFFRAESPNGLSTFGLASLSKSGNIIQLVNLIFARITGGSGGGGGGGMSRSAAASVSPPTEMASPTPAALEPVDTIPPLQEEPPAPKFTSTPVGTPAAPAEPAPPATSEAPGISRLGSLVEGTSSLIILRNLSVVFVVIFVTAVFFLRWKR